jgi:hypothetical protein
VPLQVVVLVLWPLSYAGLAVTTSLELVASGLTGQRSDQLSYATKAPAQGIEPRSAG